MGNVHRAVLGKAGREQVTLPGAETLEPSLGTAQGCDRWCLRPHSPGSEGTKKPRLPMGTSVLTPTKEEL